MAVPSPIKRTWAQVANCRPSHTKPGLLSYNDDLPPLSATLHMKRHNVASVPLLTVTYEELDPRNTRLFIKVGPNDCCDFSDVFSLLRTFGSIRCLCYNTKRGNGIVDYKQKSSAIQAKNTIQHIVLPAGYVTLKLFWGKHIDRSLPIQVQNPSLAEQVERARIVHKKSTKVPLIARFSGWLEESLGIEVDKRHFSENIVSTGTVAGLGSEEAVFGRYPLRSKDWWFENANGTTNNGERTLGDLLESSYRRSVALSTFALESCINFDGQLLTPPNSPSYWSLEHENGHLPSKAPNTPNSSNSSGYTTCCSSPSSFASTPSTSGKLPMFED